MRCRALSPREEAPPRSEESAAPALEDEPLRLRPAAPRRLAARVVAPAQRAAREWVARRQRGSKETEPPPESQASVHPGPVLQRARQVSAVAAAGDAGGASPKVALRREALPTGPMPPQPRRAPEEEAEAWTVQVSAEAPTGLEAARPMAAEAASMSDFGVLEAAPEVATATRAAAAVTTVAAPSTALRPLRGAAREAAAGSAWARRPCLCRIRRPFGPSRENPHSNAFRSGLAPTKTAAFRHGGATLEVVVACGPMPH